MLITNESLYSYLLYSDPVKYSDDLTLYPITMDKILEFSMYKQSIIVRKNSTFTSKQIIKMSYLQFLYHCHGNVELAKEYNMPLLPLYYSFAFQLLKLAFKEQDVKVNIEKGGFLINDKEVDDDMFDDIRRIIILQNGIDFDIDEFIHYDTEQELKKAEEHVSGKDNATLEDYIDSLCVALGVNEEYVRTLTIRKFWRYVKRISKRDIFQIMKSAESTGMVKFNEPLSYWMTELDTGDKYKNVKTDSETIKKMVSGN